MEAPAVISEPYLAEWLSRAEDNGLTNDLRSRVQFPLTVFVLQLQTKYLKNNNLSLTFLINVISGSFYGTLPLPASL